MCRPFQIDLKKWRSLKSSHLFSNLSAKSVPDENGDLSLVITGIELPSRHFSPEVSLTASLTNPEVAGGVSKACKINICVLR